MRLFLLHIGFIFLTAFALQGQDEPFLLIEVSNTDIEIGQSISITVKSNAEGNFQLTFPDEFLQNSATHSGMSSSINYINGQKVVERVTFKKLSGVFSKVGVYELGPISMQTNQGEILSNVVSITVKKPLNMISADPSKNLSQPIFGIIQQSKKAVYQGEALFVEAKIYSQIDIYQVDNFIPFRFEGVGETHQLQHQQQVTQQYEKIGGKQLLTFQLGRSVIFPEQTGTYEISPFEMVLFYEDPRRLFPERAKIRSNESQIQVKPLPKGAPEYFTGGVGKFKISSSSKNNSVDQGDVVEFSLTIAGHGNLHLVTKPKLDLPKGIILYGDPEKKENIRFTNNGAEGEITYNYYLQVNSPSDITIPSVSMSYFCLNEEVYKTVYSNSIPLSVSPSKTPIALVEKTEETESSAAPMISKILPEKTVYRPTQLFNLSGKIILGTPLLLGLIFGLFYHMKNRSTENDKRISPAENKALTLTKMRELLESNETDKQFYLSELKSYFENYLGQLHHLEHHSWNELLNEITEKQMMGESAIQELKDIYDQIELEKYNPDFVAFDKNTLINKSIQLIENIASNEV